MRIVFLAWQGSVHTRRWVAFFARRGHEVHVITCGDGTAWDTADERNRHPYAVHEVGTPKLGKLGYFAKIPAVRRLIRRIEPDVVHAHFVTSYGMLGLYGGFRPLVVTAHGDDVLITPQRQPMRWLVQRVLKEASIITVPSEPMRSAVIELLGADQTAAGFPIAVFQYGVETERLQLVAAVARATEHTRDRPVVISTRAFLDLYRIDLLIEAVAELRDRGILIDLQLAGDGPLRAALEQRVSARGLEEQVSFLGHVAAAELEHHVARADLFASVAESDGVSLSLLEALALGTVPVLSDIPANRSWIAPDESGVLVDLTVQSVADGIVRALALDRDAAASVNVATVVARADRDVNLGACELLIDELVGVTWVPE